MGDNNLALWDAVSTTDEKNTKHVNQRGGFTAINAQSQVKAATEQWGPMGGAWGVEWEREDAPEGLFLVRVRLWYPNIDGDAEGGRVNQYGCAEWGSRLDHDAPKKAVTDGMTKCLSLLGFNADIFLGEWDDNKYASDQKAAAKKVATKPQPDGKVTVTDLAKLQAAIKARCIALSLDPNTYLPICGKDVIAEMGHAKSSDIPASSLPAALELVKKWEQQDSAPGFVDGEAA